MIGELNKRIVIKTRTSTQNSLGEVGFTYTTIFATVWAKVEYLGGDEGEISNVQTTTQKLKFTIRNDFDKMHNGLLTSKHRIVYNYGNYDISGIEQTPDSKFLIITATETKPGLSA